jgi:hypothetical protein
MFGTIIDKIQTLLSRSFLFGNLLPVLLFSVLNLAIIYLGVPDAAVVISTHWPANISDAPGSVGVALVAIAMLGFILRPLVPVFRAALEGGILPPPLQKELLASREATFGVMAQQQTDAGIRAAELKRARAYAEQVLGDARNANAPRPGNDPARLAAATQAFDALRAQIRQRKDETQTYRRLPDMQVINDVITSLTTALEFYPMLSTQPNFDQATRDSLNRMQFNLLSQLQDLKDLANVAAQEADAPCRVRFASGNIRATALENSRLAMEQYTRVAYNVSFDFLWPRLLMVVPTNKSIADAVEVATATLDFAILMTALSALTTLGWMLVMPFVGDSLLLYLAVAVMGPALVSFFYRLADASQQGIGVVATMAIDGLRFDLLTALHLPLPTSISDEQKVWPNLELALYSAIEDEIYYKHSKT